MAEKDNKPISNKQFAFFGGIALALLGVILILNMWVVARALTFPFVYAFGIPHYVFFAYMYVQGMSLIIRKKAIKFRFSLVLLGFLLVIVSSSLLFTAFYKPSYNFSSYNTYFSSLEYITAPAYLNIFSSEIAGGYVGIAIYQLLNNIASPLPYILGFFVLVVGLVLIFLKPIIALFSKIKKREPRERKPKKTKKTKKTTPTDGQIEELVITKDYSMETIKEASIIDDIEDDDDEDDDLSVTPTPIPISDSTGLGGVSDASFRPGVFTPAHFIPGVIPGDTPPSIPSSQQVTPTREEPVQQVINPTTQTIKEEPVEPTKREQLTLDFDAEPTVDQRIVTAQPVFQEPVSTKQTVTQQVTSETQPVVKKKIKWVPPSNELLEEYETSEQNNKNIETAEQRSALINQIFKDFKVGAEVEGYIIGPAVTRYNIKYQPNVQSRSVENIVKDIAIRLGGVACRFEAIVEGSYYSGLEIPNAVVTTVSYKDVFTALPEGKKYATYIGFGKNIQGEVVSADFRKFPHVLVAGTTGSGKSIFIHSIISTLIMRNSPEDLKLVLVDPKKVEMVKYREIPHLLCPIINDPVKTKPLLDKLVNEMNRRYELLSQGDGYSDISEYNEYAEENGLDKVPVIIAILDEFGDLVETCKEIATPVVLLGQKARACGIHMLLATQSPTSDIITSAIKSNLPTHVALSTASASQSVVILGQGGAEKLLGKGDMLVDSRLVCKVGFARLQGCFISPKEITRIAGYLREHYETQYDPEFLNLEEEAAQEGQAFVAGGGTVSAMDAAEEAKYQSIKEWVMTQQYTSMSRIQGDCGVGFNRARRFFNRLVQEGVVSPVSEGNKGCKVLSRDTSMDYDPDDVPVSDELTD